MTLFSSCSFVLLGQRTQKQKALLSFQSVPAVGETGKAIEHYGVLVSAK